MTDMIKATIFIPTYNGEEYLGDILRMIYKQKTDFKYEVLIIDSGSTDATLSIIKKYQEQHDNLNLKEIPNSEFGHGKTRNLAAQLAKGEFVVYLSHDAIPAHKEWLVEMLAPFEISDKVAGVTGKQDPRRKCFPLMKYDIQKVFSGLGSDWGVTLYQKVSSIKNQAAEDAASFYSDVNSAARKDFLLNVIPYQDLPYAEDMAFGRDIIEAGYIKAYASRGNVIHSNDVTLSEYRFRIYDETVGLRRAGHVVHRVSIPRFLVNVFRGSSMDTVRIMLDSSYSRKRKLYWLVVNPLFHIQRWRGVRQGSMVSLADDESHAKNSLENKRKS